MGSLVTTTRVRLPAGPHDPELDRSGALFGRLERLLHVRLRDMERAAARAAGPQGSGAREGRNALKRSFCAQHGITARHYNSLFRALEGKHAAVTEKARIDAEDLAGRLDAVRRKIAETESRLAADAAARVGIAAREVAGKPPSRAQAKMRLTDRDRTALRRGLHGRRQKAARLAARIGALRRTAALRVPPVVFGSRKLLRSQPTDAASPDFADWRHRWREARSAQIFCVGSRDEPGGSQSCRPLWDGWETGHFGLRLRRLGPVPEGDSSHLDIHGIPLHPHARALLGAIRARFASGSATAVSVRLLRTPGDVPVPAGMSRWEALITAEELTPETDFAPGRRVLGVDVNADHLAWALLAPDGNRLRTGRLPLPFDGLDAAARRSLTCEAAAALVRIAETGQAQIAVERLDFSRKKRELSLRPEAPARRRKLHALPYAAVLEAIRRRAARAGVPLREVNPAYTSLIGRVNHATRQGISTHRAAALAIGRRAQGHRERIHYLLEGSGASVPPAGAEKPRRHVWVRWAQVLREVSRRDAEARKSARSRGGGESPAPGPGPFRGRRPASGRIPPRPFAPVNDRIPDFPYVPGQTPTGNTVTPPEPDMSGSGRGIVRNDNAF